MKIQHRCRNEVVTIHPGVRVSKELGNGLRTILAETVTITVYPGWTHVLMRGRAILRNGGIGRFRELGWVAHVKDDVYTIDDKLPAEVETVLEAILKSIEGEA